MSVDESNMYLCNAIWIDPSSCRGLEPGVLQLVDIYVGFITYGGGKPKYLNIGKFHSTASKVLFDSKELECDVFQTESVVLIFLTTLKFENQDTFHTRCISSRSQKL